MHRIHTAGGSGHEHITEVEWQNPADGKTGRSSREVMVDFIKNKTGDARVIQGGIEVKVGVVEAAPPHLRTIADGRWTNNLLSLPRY